MSNKYPNIKGILKNAEDKTKASIEKVENAIKEMLKEKIKINFNSVAEKSGVSKSFLYNNEKLKERINTLRKNQGVVKERKEMTQNSKDIIIQALRKKVEELEKENEKLRKLQKDKLSDLYEQI